MSATKLGAVVFDFDGTLVDTEWSIYQLAATAFTDFGIDLDVPTWASIVGLADGEWWERLVDENGWAVDRDRWFAVYDALDRTFRDTLPAVDGAARLLDGLAREGVPLAVASSSSAEWVAGHLERLGLLDRFAVLAGADRTGGVGKPSPDVYVLACADLGVDPAACVAVEDTSHGIEAAHAAGLVCVAVPSRITRHTDLSAADLTVASLADLSVAALRDLVTARH